MKLASQAGRYIHSLKWVVADAFPRWKSAVGGIVACNFFGLASMLAAVGGVMAFARAAEQQQPMTIFSRQLTVTGSVGALIAFGAVIASLGILSAICVFMADRVVLLLARRYHEHCADRALTLVSDPLNRGWQISDRQSPRAIVLRLTGSASRAMALTLRDLLRAMLPTMAVVATVGFLAYIDAGLTAMLIPVAALYLVPLYVINRRVTRTQRIYRQLSPQARGEMSRRLREALDQGLLMREARSSHALRSEMLQGEARQGALGALYGRLLADRRVHVLNAAFFVVCLVTIIVIFGLRATSGSRAWADLIFYLLGLRYAISALKQTTMLGAKFSRFYPECLVYTTFVDRSEDTRARRMRSQRNPVEFPPVLTLRLGRKAKWKSVRSLRVPRGGIVAVLAPESPGFADLEAVLLLLEQRLDERIDLSTTARFIGRADERLESESLDARTLVISSDAISKPRAAMSAEQLQERTHHLAILVGNDAAQVLRLASTLDVAAVVVIEEHRIVGGGDWSWFESHREDISSSLRMQRERSRYGSAQDSDDTTADEADE